MMAKRHLLIIMTAVSFLVLMAKAVTVSPKGSDEINSILNDLSPEDIEALVKAAAQRRLLVERQAVAAEISQNLLYDEVEVEKAVAKLQANDKSSKDENIVRICEAYAIVDGRFSGPYNLYKNGKYAEAEKKLKPMLNMEDTTYLSAAMHFIRADSLARAGKYMDAAEAFSDILVNMPDRLSFATSSARKAAEVYEQAGRNYYAMQMYTYCLANYSLTLSRAELDEMLAKVKKFREIYASPMKTIIGMMDDVEKSLAQKDTNEKVQNTQEQIVALLDDMIKTAEESQRQKDKDQQKQQSRQRRKDAGSQQADEKKQGAEAQGSQASNTEKPGSPANESVLVPGPVTRPNKLAQKHQAKGTGRWADMPPRQREKLESIMRKRLGERRTGLVRDYHKKLAEGE